MCYLLDVSKLLHYVINSQSTNGTIAHLEIKISDSPVPDYKESPTNDSPHTKGEYKLND